MAELLSVLEPKLGGWEVAMWFDTSNGWLEGEGPHTLIDDDPERVVDAARYEVAPQEF